MRFATLAALQNGKHVYCEKPLTHNIWEARVIREAAAKTKVATQMGIQIHAGDNYRRVVELIQTGAIGKVTRGARLGRARLGSAIATRTPRSNSDIVSVQERPKESAVPPRIWIGTCGSARRPNGRSTSLCAGPKWYRWWDFGNGTMSDLGSHWNDLPFWALELKAPLTIEASGPPPHPEIAPASMTATYAYGPRGDMPAVEVSWYQGTNKPEHVDRREDPAMEQRRALRRRQGDAALRLQQARAACPRSSSKASSRRSHSSPSRWAITQNGFTRARRAPRRRATSNIPAG